MRGMVLTCFWQRHHSLLTCDGVRYAYPKLDSTMFAAGLMICSASIILLLGVIHLLYTFVGVKLTPCDIELKNRMSQVTPVITKETTMWKAWIGFNASHSMGAILFGLIYGYLALQQSQILFHSTFLLFVGFAMLGGLFILGKVYWFRVPFFGISISFAFYIASVLVSKTLFSA